MSQSNLSIERCNQEQREIEARGEDAPDGLGAAMGWADWEVEKWLSRPLCIDLFCGLGGWTEGFLAEGWNVIGFDNHQHEYGWTKCPECDGTGNFYRRDEDDDYLMCDCVETHGTYATEHEGMIPNRYPAQLVIQDVLTLHGSQFRNVDCIVASPPCQRYSWMAMPWSLAKREVSWQRWQRDSPFSTGFDLNDLFNACFRIQREASEAAGRHIPMVVENVKGAQPWVGKAKAHFGSYYLWGDVESVGRRIVCGLRPRFGETISASKNGRKVPGFNFHAHEKGEAGGSFQSAAVARLNDSGRKMPAEINESIRKGKSPMRWTNPAGHYFEAHGVKIPGNAGRLWKDREVARLGDALKAQRYREENGTKQGGGWHDPESISVKTSSRSDSRKAASAEIAKIPFPLSRWIAQVMRPSECRSARDVHGPDGAQNGALTTHEL